MSYVKIGSEQRPLAQADEHWIADQLRRRRSAGASTCVQVYLKTSSIDVVLSTPDCTSGGGGGRPPTQQERELIDLWAKRGLNDPYYTVGSLVAFLKQIGQSGIS